MASDNYQTGGLTSEAASLSSIVTSHLGDRLETLVDRSIEIAKSNGYAPFTTTIRAAWVEAILSVTEGLGNYLTSCDAIAPGPHATLDYRADPRFDRMRKIARQHRSLGITLPMYVGLFKHFRNLYTAELAELRGVEDPCLADRVRGFFDETELSIVADWHHSDDNVRLRELQERSRVIALDKDRYFAIFESLRNPAFLLDKSQNLVNANQSAAELFLGDAQAGDIIYLRSMRQRKQPLQDVIDRIKEAENDPDDSVWLDTLRGRKCFDVRRRALHDAVENIAIGHVVLLNDVTEHRREAERAQQSERGMSRFLATMSHEIRTPLHSVLGATELLRTADGDGAEDYLDVIEAAGQTLLQTLNNVLDYSKLGNGLPVPRPTAINLVQMVSAFDRVATAGRNRDGTPLQIVIAPELPSWLRIDWAMTQQVLSNLVSNAVRVAGGRGVVVGLSDVTANAGERVLRVEVRDHGPGIPPEDAEALFRPFDSANARETGSGGAGLGLAISHHLVEALGGKIGYRNCEDGALVWFEVPFEACSQPVSEAPDLPVPADPVTRDRPHCLLVDDDPIGSTVTTRLLERLGFRVDHAETVAEAFRLAQAAAYDVFVVDYILPDGNGPELVRGLRDATSRTARYVALTANVEALAGDDVTSRLFHRILAKPVDQKTLSSALLVPTNETVPAFKPETAYSNASLQGLSSETIHAMTEAFQKAWCDFRSGICTSTDRTELAVQAHRLAGSTAILGLSELEAPLRELERHCHGAGDQAEIASLLGQLDRDLPQIRSWVELRKLAGSP